MAIYDKASLVLIPSGSKTSKVYSQKPTNGDGDFTFSRSTAATRVNASGNIEKGTENLLLQSNTFSTTWTNSNSSETSGQSGYDGTNDAWLLTATGSPSAQINQAVSLNSVHTFSVYAKANTAGFVELVTIGGGGANPRAWFDLSTGSVGSSYNVIEAKMVSVGSGWYRCSITLNANITNYRIYVAEANDSTAITIGDSIYIQDAQLEQGLVARDYIETTTTAIYGGITDNVPRLDYQGSCPALLLEPQRTNLFTQSEYFGSDWILQSNVNLTYNDIESPEGLINGVKYNISSNVQRALDQNVTLSNGNTYTFSLYVKPIVDTTIRVRDNIGGWIEDINVLAADGWQRITSTKTITSSSTQLGFFDNSGNSGDRFYFYGAQLEQGSYATSYIPTYGSAVTRNADTNVRIESVSDLIGQTEGTLFFEGNAVPNAEIISIHRSTLGSIFILSNGSGLVQFYAWYGNGVTINHTANIDAGSNFKAAFSYKNGDSALYCNGQQIALKTEVFDPQTTLSSIWIAQGNYAGSKNKVNTKQALVFPTRLSNEELATLTTI